MRILSAVVEPDAGDVPRIHAKITQRRVIRWQFIGVVTLRAISQIWSIDLQTKSLKSHV
jgi:hypothetical protein